MADKISYIADVKAFHNKFGLETPSAFTFLPADLYKFRVGFFNEELTEYIEAHRNADLGTAIDSLVDLIYIINGCALLHGIDVDIFNELNGGAAAVELVDVYPIMESDEPAKENGPDYLSATNHERFVQLCFKNIDSYEKAHAAQDEVGVKRALVEFYNNVLYAASDMGITQEAWDEFWSDVQRANMSKERAQKASDSKRGSAWDVIKPAGWVGPRTEEILAKYKKRSNNV